MTHKNVKKVFVSTKPHFGSQIKAMVGKYCCFDRNLRNVVRDAAWHELRKPTRFVHVRIHSDLRSASAWAPAFNHDWKQAYESAFEEAWEALRVDDAHARAEPHTYEINVATGSPDDTIDRINPCYRCEECRIKCLHSEKTCDFCKHAGERKPELDWIW